MLRMSPEQELEIRQKLLELAPVWECAMSRCAIYPLDTNERLWIRDQEVARKRLEELESWFTQRDMKLCYNGDGAIVRIEHIGLKVVLKWKTLEDDNTRLSIGVVHAVEKC